MPPLFMNMPSAPIIIPITALVVVAFAVVLLIFHLLRKLVSCPHHRSKYPFHDQDPSKIKSVLPTSPYTIDPSSNTANSNSIYYVKGGPTSMSTSGFLLYPPLAASAPSRSPSSTGGGPHHPQHHHLGGSYEDITVTGQDQTFSLDNVDGPENEIGLRLIHSSPSSASSSHHHHQLPSVGEESHSLIPRSSAALGGAGRSSSTSPTFHPNISPQYDEQEHTTIKTSMSYHRSEREYIIEQAGSSHEQSSYESDV